MNLGVFSLSLNVRDLQASVNFYRKLGFEVIAGQPAQKWIIMKNGQAKIGLFQDKFDRNIMTFNPPDARQIQRTLKSQGVNILKETDENGTGRAHIALADPDGNMILIDQI